MTNSSIEDRLATAVSLRERGELSTAREILLELHRDHPGEAAVSLQCAWVHDRMGLERAAIPFYETAIELGLDGDDLRHALVGLGSTYRALGEYDRALSTLSRATELFPGDRGIEVFRAMAMYNNGLAKEAFELLLRLLAETSADPELVGYRRALQDYAKDIDRIWT